MSAVKPWGPRHGGQAAGNGVDVCVYAVDGGAQTASQRLATALREHGRDHRSGRLRMICGYQNRYTSRR